MDILSLFKKITFLTFIVLASTHNYGCAKIDSTKLENKDIESQLGSRRALVTTRALAFGFRDVAAQ